MYYINVSSNSESRFRKWIDDRNKCYKDRVNCIVFHSRGSCEHLWTVFQGGMAHWKMCTKSEGLLPMPGRIDGYWWNLGMSSFRLTGAKKTFGCEIATLWNQRRVKSELCEGWSKMPIWCQVFVKATWSFSQMATTIHLMARLVLSKLHPLCTLLMKKLWQSSACGQTL